MKTFSESIQVGFRLRTPLVEAGSEAEFPPPATIEGNIGEIVTSFQ